MSLPKGVIDFLNNSAQANGAAQRELTDDLFVTGTLDSFALVDFVTVLEEQCDIRVPDAEVIPANFRTLEAIDDYVKSKTVLA